MFDGTVATRYGLIRGVEQEGIWTFLGVRYARAPEGPDRFRPPMPPEPWSGVREANEPSPIAPQPPSGIGSYVPGDPTDQHEDCLSLNVWTPACDDARRPVVVFIHGGAFLSGSGSGVMYRGAHLAEHGLVVVTINYRLGVIGFLAHPDLAGPSGEGTANRGLQDQVAALSWVREHIDRFGGDPGKVTLIGESSGAMSAADLLGAPSATGLFARLVLQSGATVADPPERALAAARRFGDELGLRDFTAETLGAVPLAELLAAQHATAGELGRSSGMPYRPVIDGTFLPRHPDVAIAAGATRGLDLLVGTNRDEFRLFTYGEAAFDEMPEEVFEALVDEHLPTAGVHTSARSVIVAYRDARRRRGEPTTVRDLYEAIATDLVFRLPQLRLASLHAARGGRSFAYRFDWGAPFAGGMLGACHALELPFVFGTIDNPVIGYFAGSDPAAYELSAAMQGAWAAFAATGDPSHEGVGQWPRYEESRRATMVLDHAITLEEAPGEEERAFLDAHLGTFGERLAGGRVGAGRSAAVAAEHRTSRVAGT